jgi:glycosyltransferase involved in cell wall biosynthesis
VTEDAGPARAVRVLFIEPYDGGSHRAFREGLTAHSRHHLESLTLPPRFWKWRMRGAAVHFADLLNARSEWPYDLILTTDFLNLADLRGLLAPPRDRTPCLLYLHENQLTYPLSPQEEFDFHFGFTNILSALAADHVVFNSTYHRDLFLDGLPRYLARMPEAVPRGVRQRLEARSSVLPVGLARVPHPPSSCAPYLGGACDGVVGPGWPRGQGPPVILWNHRWEFDKRPRWFARALSALRSGGVDFQVLLLGDPRANEAVFDPLRERLGDRCLAWGWIAEREQYEAWLARADIVVSCAAQEYFGIAVAEAVHAGAYPVLPRDQVYPSLYGTHCRGRHLYRDEHELLRLLRDVLAGRCGHVCSLPLDVDVFCWPRLAPDYDQLLAEVAAAGRLP